MHAGQLLACWLCCDRRLCLRESIPGLLQALHACWVQPSLGWQKGICCGAPRCSSLCC